MPVLPYLVRAKTLVFCLLICGLHLHAQKKRSNSSAELEYIFPQNFAIIDHLTHLLQWKSPNDGKRDIVYKVYHWEAIQEGLTRREALSTNGTFLVKNLKPNTTYIWQIVEHNMKDSTQIKGPVYQYRTTYRAKKNLSSKDLQVYYVEDYNRAYISEIDAQYSRLGDTIYIRGDYFGEDKDNAKVLLNGNELEIVDYFHDFVAARVPDTLRYKLQLQLKDRTIKAPYTPYLMRRKQTIYINSLRTDFDDIDEIDFHEIDGYSHWFQRQVIDTLNSLWSDFLGNRMRDSLRTMNEFISDTTILIPTDSLSSIYAPIALINGRLEEMWHKLLEEKISDTLKVILKNYQDRRLGISLESTRGETRGLEVKQMQVQIALDSIWTEMLSGKVEDSVLRANEAYFRRTAVVSEDNDTIAQILLPSIEINQALSNMWRDVFSEKLKDTLLKIRRDMGYDSIAVDKNRLGIENLLLSEEYVNKKIDEQIALGNITTDCDCSQIDSLQNIGLNDLFSVGELTPIATLFAKNKEAMNMDTINLLLGGYLERFYKNKEARIKAEQDRKARLAREKKRAQDSILQAEIAQAEAEMLAQIEQQRMEDSLMLVQEQLMMDSLAYLAKLDSIRVADSTRLAQIQDSIHLHNLLAELGDTIDIYRLKAKGIDPLDVSVQANSLANMNTLKFKINHVFEQNQKSMFSRTLHGQRIRFDGESLGSDIDFAYNYSLKALPQYSRLTDNSVAYESHDMRFIGINIHSDVLGINPMGAITTQSPDTRLQLSKPLHYAGGTNRENGRLDLKYDDVFNTQLWAVSAQQEGGVQLDDKFSVLSKTNLSYIQRVNATTAFRINGQLSRTTLRSPLNYSQGKVTNNIYGDERVQDLSSAGINQLIRREGFHEQVFAPEMNPLNWAVNGEITTRFGFDQDSPKLSYGLIASHSKTNFQSESRFRIDDYLFHAHKVDLTSPELNMSIQYKQENIGEWLEYHQLANHLLNQWKSNENWYQDFSLAFNGNLIKGDNARIFAGIAPVSNQVESAILFANNRLLNNDRLNKEQIDSLQRITGQTWQRNDNLKFKEGSTQFNTLYNQLINRQGYDQGGKTSKHSDITLELDYRLPQMLWIDQWQIQMYVNQKSINTSSTYLMDNSSDISYTDAYLNNVLIYQLPWSNNLFLRTNINGEFNTNFGVFGSGSLGVSWSSKIAQPAVVIVNEDQDSKILGKNPLQDAQDETETKKPNHHGLLIDYSFRRRTPNIRSQYLASNLGYASVLGGLESALETYSDHTLYSKDPLTFAHLKANSYQLDVNHSPIRSNEELVPWQYKPLTPELIHALQAEYQFNSPTYGLTLVSGIHATMITDYITVSRFGTTISSGQSREMYTGRYKTYLMYQNSQDNMIQAGVSTEAKYEINKKFALEANLIYNQWMGNTLATNLPGINGYMGFMAYDIEPDLDIITRLRYVGAYDYQGLWYQETLPDRYLMDFEILYYIRPIQTQFIIGGENVFNKAYRNSTGTGVIGGYYYINLRHDF